MKRIKLVAVAAVTCAVLSGATAYAWHLEGRVTCPNGTAFEGVVVNVADRSGGGFNGFGVTDSEGFYVVWLPDVPGSFTAILDPETLPPDAIIKSPAPPAEFATTADDWWPTVDWVVDSPSLCGGACWFTGGGAKIDPLIDIPVATKGKLHSFGGNVYPGCSPTAGDGGNWNHVARGDIKLHFKGTSIRIVECGNAYPPAPPEGSTSPRTPVNFIKFEGTGTLKGIQGNKADFGTVQFFAYCEDRNEPGSQGAHDGALIDRYYLRVWNVDSEGKEVVRLLINGPDSDFDPVPITDGNLQLHASSCDNPPF